MQGHGRVLEVTAASRQAQRVPEWPNIAAERMMSWLVAVRVLPVSSSKSGESKLGSKGSCGFWGFAFSEVTPAPKSFSP